MNPTIESLSVTCKKCGAVIKLTDALVAPLIEKERAAQAEGLETERRSIREEEEFRAKHAAERAAEARLKQADELMSLANREIAEYQKEARERDKKLAVAQAEQARLLSKERELDDARREMDLTIARKVIAETGSIRQTVEREVAGQAALALAERDERLRSLTGQIEELKRRAEQGDNRVAGEAQEVVLESMLRERFPRDEIVPIAKGVYGGDVLQLIDAPPGSRPGAAKGAILWESKRTKAWDDKWVNKLTADQRAAGADIAIIATQAMPKSSGAGVVFDILMPSGVWVVEWAHVYPAALAARNSLLAVAEVRVAQQGQATKAEAMYTYLTGPRFKARMQAVVERFQEMGDDLRKERAATTRLWAKREEQIRGAVEAAAGCVGDVAGIAGKEMPEIEALTLQVGDGK